MNLAPAPDSNELNPGAQLGTFIAALFDLAWASAYFAVWRQPGRFREDDVTLGINLFLMEFLLIHATGFLFATSTSEPGRKWKPALFGGFAVFYLAAAAIMSATMGSRIPFVLMLGLVVGDFLIGILRRQPGAPAISFLAIRFWVSRLVIFLAVVFLCTFIPLPQGGVEANPYGDGIWDEEPWRGLAAGAFFFLFCGIDRLVVAFRGKML